ncbi:MAG: DUF3365 domain-containing protein [Deltaproteobacteria bacterium]|nr:DUF3365 domain-containing protein [Candidatus Tharpella sp.]
MGDQLSSIKNHKYLLRYSLAAAVAWTLVLFGLGFFNSQEHLYLVRSNVIVQARDSFNKDLVFRRWVAGHGGVYVPPTAESPPNPYLSHLPQRDLTTCDGQHLTLLNPAYVMRQIHELGLQEFGLRGHITSLKPLRPENHPDAWEEQALKRFSNEVDEVVAEVLIEGQPYLRLIKPLYVEERCLKCHAVQGYKIGELRGGTCVSVDMGPYLEGHHLYMRKVFTLYAFLWLVGLTAIYISFWHNRKRLVKNVESELQINRLSSLIEQSNSAIAIVRLDGVIEYVNHGYEVISGYTADEMLGRRLRELFFAEEKIAESKALWQAISHGHRWRGVLVSRYKSGLLVHEDTIGFPLLDKSGKVINYAVIKHDVSQIYKLQEQLVMSQKMEAVGTLASGVAHDFNNLLTVINSFSEILIDECDDDSPILLDLVEINKAGCRAADLTRQLLAFSRRQIIHPRELNLLKLIENLMKMMRRLLSEDIVLQFDLSEKAVFVKADPGQFEQVIINLLVNARDALKQNGGTGPDKKIVLRLTEVEFDESFAAVNEGCRSGDYALIEIIDNGCGMSREAQHRCFEPFYTTKELGQGTGLGLSTVYGIVKQNDAYINLSSELGQGTTIQIYWPLSQAVVDVVESGRASQRDLTSIKGARVLLVEDDEKIRHLGKRRLLDVGLDVIVAVDGQDALDKVAEWGKVPDLLFTDVVMPRIGGFELGRRLKECYPGLPVIYTSGYSDDDPAFKALGENEDYLQKPYSFGDLLEAIERLLKVRSK